MILRTLVDLAKREGLVDDPDYEPKPVRWVIKHWSWRQAPWCRPNEVIDDRTKKSKPGVMQVPRSPVRTSGSAAAFLVDKAEYALGFDPDDNPKKVSKLPIHNRLFAEHVAERPENGCRLNPVCKLSLAFLRNDDDKAQCIAAIRDRAVGNDLFAFRVSPRRRVDGLKSS